jgi:hypothetical protein
MEEADELGIRFESGALDRREMGWRRRQAEVAELMSKTLLRCVLPGGIASGAPGEAAPGNEERYEDVGDYDPVLRSHCRL